MDNRTATITQSGGNVTFYSDAGTTVGGTGGIYFVNQSNTANAALVYTYNLNGGTLTVPQIVNNGPGGTSAGVLFLNGGTLKATGDTFAFITTGPHNGASNNTPQVRSGRQCRQRRRDYRHRCVYGDPRLPLAS